MNGNGQIILCFSDSWQAIKCARWLILFSALFFATLVFGYLLLKPPTFTATATFKGHSNNKLSKAMEFFGKNESYLASDDPKVFLKSYPVLESVVQSLHLQMTIVENKKTNPLKPIWDTLKAQRAGRLLKKKRPQSSILNLPVTSEPIISDSVVLLECTNLAYPKQTSSELILCFLDATHFQVKQNKLLIGNGALGKPFEWEGGSFTLNSTTCVTGKTFNLSFIPLHAATKSLKKSIRVKRSDKDASITHISFTHQDRHLAAAIVNQTMKAFQNYLKKEGKRKNRQQLNYLQQRQNESFATLEAVLEEHKTYLESLLNAGGMFTFEQELQFMTQKQAQARQELDRITSEMTLLDKTLPFDQLLEKLRAQPSSPAQTLTIEGARSLIQNYQESLDHIQLECQQYDFCLSKLKEPDFDTSSLCKVINDPSLNIRFDKIHTLQHKLIDEKNWTTKERDLLREELNTERLFLNKHITDLKKGALIKHALFNKRLAHLQGLILFFLFDQYQGVEKHLQQLAQKAAHFPQKWLTEQKIALNTRLHTELIDSITKMIEVKNMGYHLDYLNARPLMQSMVPIIPDSPHLFLGFVVGASLGGFLILAFIVLREAWLGPSTSYANLKSEGKSVICFTHTLEDLKRVHYHLRNSGPILLIHAWFAKDLSLLFSKGGERILLIDLTKTAKTQNFTDTEFGKTLTLSEPSEIFLGSSQFQKLLEEQTQSFNRIVLFSTSPLDSLQTQVLSDLADHSVVMLNNQRLEQLPSFPEKTLYVTQNSFNKSVGFSQILPLLKRTLGESEKAFSNKSLFFLF